MPERFVSAEELESVLQNQIRFLNMIGDRSVCKSCGRTIWWVRTKNDRKMPVTDELVSHFADCPAADRHRRKEG